MATGLARKMWTVEEYERLIERGVFDEDYRIELIRGEIVEMTPIGFRHVNCVNNLGALFYELPKDMVTVSIQNPLQLPDNSEPQPDVTILKGPRSLYNKRKRLATWADALLVVEVSDATLKIDRTIKLPLYAGAGIPEAWIVNLDAELVEVYREPVDGVYRQVSKLGRGGEVALPGGLPGAVSVDEVLG